MKTLLRPTLLLSTIGLFLTTGVASAIPTLTLRHVETNTSVTVTDVDLDGVLLFNGPVGHFVANVTSAFTKPLIGSESQPILSLTSADVTSPGQAAGTLEITFSDDGFTATPLQALVGRSLVAIVGGNSVDFNAQVNGVDYVPDITLTTGGFADVLGGVVSPLTPYSVALKAVVNHVNAGSTSLGFQFTAVPEPGFYGLLSLGLTGIVLVARRRASSQTR